MIFRFGELFCGAGGLSYGALSANIDLPEYSIKHVWATDIDKDACDTYRNNISANGVIQSDVRDLDFSKLDAIDALAFGFPCNDFSLVGERKGLNGSYGALYTYGVKALQYFRPAWFIAENVSGLKSSNEGKAFEKILCELQDAGYNVCPNLYKFETYGIPQARHRLIIVGIREDLGLDFKVPSNAQYKMVTCKEALESPPIPANAFNHEMPKHSSIVVERLSYIKAGENVHNANIPERLKLNYGNAKMSIVYKRLDPTKPSYTVTAAGGGGTHIYHWEEPRALTNRERARLQTFPDDFVFCGSKDSVRKQIGMAVPCAGARIICEAILKTFAGVPYEYMNAKV